MSIVIVLHILGTGEEAETLVNSLSAENVPVSEGNLTSFSSTDFQTLTDLSQELTLNHDMETEGYFFIIKLLPRIYFNKINIMLMLT